MNYYSVKETFYRIGHNPAILYEPEGQSPYRGIALLTVHVGADYLDFPSGRELAARGFVSLCANPSEGLLETRMEGVAECVSFLRKMDGVKKVLLIGHSGGATMMSAYQMAAENGSDILRGPEKLYPAREMKELPPADGVIFLDSNWGNGMITLFALHPGVVDENNPRNLDPFFDLYSERNGFNPDGSRYSDEFISRFQQAQGERMNRLIRTALDRLTVIQQGRGMYTDDEPFVVPMRIGGAMNNLLFPQDIRLFSCTESEWPLYHGDGSMTVEQVHTVRLPNKRIPKIGEFEHLSIQTTVRKFLSNYIAYSENFSYDCSKVYGVDWKASFCNTPGNVTGIHVPVLILGMTGSNEFAAAETIYKNCASNDKSLGFIEGAKHMLDTNKEAEAFPGQFGDTIKTLFDTVALWLVTTGRFDS